jgi:hypothetical protein
MLSPEILFGLQLFDFNKIPGKQCPDLIQVLNYLLISKKTVTFPEPKASFNPLGSSILPKRV